MIPIDMMFAPSLRQHNHAKLLMSRYLRSVSTGLAALLLVGATPPQESDLPRNSILLFVASWCAPCRSEIAKVDELAEAAAPMRVLVVAADDRPTTVRMVHAVRADRRWEPDGTMKERVRQQLLSQSPGLPLSIGIDRSGRPCATIRGGLTVARAAAVLDRCAP